MAFCSNCGKEISPQAAACPQCGHPGQAGARVMVSTGASGRYEGYSIASLACGIAAFVLLPVIGSILAVIFGNMARKRLAADPQLEGEGMAKAGIILGWVGIALVGLFVLFMIVALATGAWVLTNWS